LTHLSLLWATPEHVAAISRLHATVFDDRWDESAVERLLSNPGSIALLASLSAPAVIGGFVLAQVAADEAEILSIAVTPEWRRKGVARRLVDAVKRGATRGGARALFLEVAASNANAIGLYARAGFAGSGRRRDYYTRKDGTREDAIVMRCEIGRTTSA